MIRSLLPIFFFLVVALNLAAQDFHALRNDAEASQAAVTSPGAPCNNAAGEAFSEFIVKFTVDNSFNSERTKIASVFTIKPIANYKALVVTQGHEAGYVQSWDSPETDRVRLKCGYAGAPADYVYIFARRDGLWYLIDRIVDDF